MKKGGRGHRFHRSRCDDHPPLKVVLQGPRRSQQSFPASETPARNLDQIDYLRNNRAISGARYPSCKEFLLIHRVFARPRWFEGNVSISLFRHSPTISPWNTTDTTKQKCISGIIRRSCISKLAPFLPCANLLRLFHLWQSRISLKLYSDEWKYRTTIYRPWMVYVFIC